MGCFVIDFSPVSGGGTATDASKPGWSSDTSRLLWFSWFQRGLSIMEEDILLPRRHQKYFSGTLCVEKNRFDQRRITHGSWF